MPDGNHGDANHRHLIAEAEALVNYLHESAKSARLSAQHARRALNASWDALQKAASVILAPVTVSSEPSASE